VGAYQGVVRANGSGGVKGPIGPWPCNRVAQLKQQEALNTFLRVVHMHCFPVNIAREEAGSMKENIRIPGWLGFCFGLLCMYLPARFPNERS